jgi:hypothetical protein
MLFTIQNTSMGYLDHRVITHNVKLPMDANDIDIEDGFALLSGTHPPTQMSYILHKFRLYGICTKICQGVFGQTTPSYDSILALEREIHHEKTGWEARYASEDQSYTLPPYHKVHLSILDAYSHQLMLLLHRPVLIRALDNADFGPAEFNNSRNRCIDSAERLLHIQETFFKSTEFVSFRWYNEGLSSFHAFHAFIVLFVLLNSMTDATEYFELKQLLKRSLSIFEAMAGRSRVCAKAGPVLRYLLFVSHSLYRISWTPCLHIVRSTTPELPITQPRFGDQLGTRQNVSMDAISRSLEPFQWLSPSNMSWEDWNIILGSS